ncbi:hypothetical protein I5E68_05920 [Novosphingobium sp. YJ-S2-02]|uniref:Uncharacterized protein n=1 Tax=Novosphingobium aureum TaxID=2792964 RepID=A0A931HBI4_9SPHN|nr:hypothetical protein [Novosphingobium aureum]MBH0112488.1 hypothetical protein [Novosphingobium aureum]
MSATLRVRGQPLVAFLAVLAGWLGGRLINWEPPLLATSSAAEIAAAGAPRGLSRGDDKLTVPPVLADGLPGRGVGTATGDDLEGALVDPSAVADLLSHYDLDVGGRITVPLDWLLEVLVRRQPLVPSATEAGAVRPALPMALSAPSSEGAIADGRSRLGENRDSVQAFDVPVEVAAGFPESPGMPAGFAPGASRRSQKKDDGAGAALSRSRRWSGDAWALLRSGTGGAISPGALPATYGASQAGAVLRYGLAQGNPLAPAAYLRTTSTLGGMSETAAALGLSAKPLPKVPATLAMEVRVTEQSGKRRVQPAAMVVSQLPPISLPLDGQLEAYAQAGYVAGRFSTPFLDGQLRTDREVLRLDRISARLGAGLWGGAQKGAARLDAGPSASVTMPLAKGTYGRLGLDWRFRIAGEAQPDTGPALTLSAGF